MYIRRKVFSIGYDAQGKERLFSTNEILSEGAYLRMFAEKEEKKEEKKSRLTKAQKRALLAGAGVATTAAGIYGAKKLGQYLSKEEPATLKDKVKKLVGIEKEKTTRQKVGDVLQKPADLIVEGSKKGYDAVAGVVKKGLEKTKKLGKKK